MTRARVLTLGSLFSGVGGFDLGFERAGFQVRWQVEINKDCVKVLTHRWPHVRRLRDINAVVYGRASNRQRYGLMLEPVDLLCGGFPCQDVSVAGKRKGLIGSRSGLFFAFVRAIRLLKPRWVVLENVPGLLSSHSGRDFHAVLAALAECGLRRSYRILDSQYFGLAQRRERVFLVCHSRAIRDGAAAVLFESAGGDGDSQAGDEARPHVAATLRGRSSGAGVNAPGRGGEDDENLVYTLRANERNTSQGPANYISVGVHANQRGEVRTSAQAGCLSSTRSGKQYEGVMVAPTLDQSLGHHRGSVGVGDFCVAATPSNCGIARPLKSGGNDRHDESHETYVMQSGERARALTGSMFKRHDDDTDTLIPIAATLNANSGRRQIEETMIAATLTGSMDKGPQDQGHRDNVQLSAAGVRRLTPLECERLQGFPDGWTCLCGEGHRGSSFCKCKDSARYRALGNAVSVPVAEWIARRILKAEDMTA